MRYIPSSLAIFLAVLAVYSAAYLRGVSTVPFHPDESTYLYTSVDVELFWQRPAALFWNADPEDEKLQHYRILDAPLVNAVIALGRWVIGAQPLAVDWDWSKTWEQNQQAGALPSQDLLLAGRYASAVLFPFSVLFVFLAVRKTAGDFPAWTAALLLASNALALLHTRRAMAEGVLLFTTTWTMWSLVTFEKRPWLTALPAALAFCAKQSLAALMPAALLAVVWQPGAWKPEQVRRTLAHIVWFGLIITATLAVMHPFLWARPVQAFRAAVQARQELASAQVADRPDQALNTPGKKLIGMLGSLYLTPPFFAETINYQQETRAAEDAYLANPLNNLFRSLPAGGLLLVLSLYGFVLAVAQSLRKGQPPNRGLVLLAFASLIQALALLVLVPLPWQRYYLPLLPFTCLWSAFGIDQLRVLFVRAYHRARQPA
jgi:4-amino-4-deoxy-L-arabinose transferase-like glycosyltransferase